jgi:hypothetical protein
MRKKIKFLKINFFFHFHKIQISIAFVIEALVIFGLVLLLPFMTIFNFQPVGFLVVRFFIRIFEFLAVGIVIFIIGVKKNNSEPKSPPKSEITGI